jgi:hypothetical protein
MRLTLFDPRALPARIGVDLLRRLRRAHDDEPFSPLEPRVTVRRAIEIVEAVGLRTTVYRGGLDLRGSEVDHVWLAVDAVPGDRYVVDAAFPLFAEGFVSALRAFVAGDADPEQLLAIAARADIDERVLGLFPEPLRYLGRPVWTATR